MLLFSPTTARPMHRVRALAEAYGLTVGYDSAKNMATVVGAARTTNSTGSFSSQWTVTEKPVTRYGNEHILHCRLFRPAFHGQIQKLVEVNECR